MRCARMTDIIKLMEMKSTSSGLTGMPFISSSKNRTRPAEDMGMGLSDLRLLDISPSPHL